MFRNIIFFAPKKQVTLSFLLLFVVGYTQKTLSNNELVPVLGINPQPFNELKDSVNGLRKVLENPEISVNVNIFSAPRNLSFLALYGTSFTLVGTGAFTIKNELNRNDELRKARIAAGASMIGSGLVLLLASKKINDFIFG